MAHDQQEFVDGWVTYSDWIDDLRNDSDIERYDEIAEFRQSLKSCQTNLDRFKLIWNDLSLRDAITRRFQQDLTSCKSKRQRRLVKSIDASRRHRELGNASFKEGKHLEAVNFYTLAVKLAPYPTREVKDESLAFALANRSAALFALTRYRVCLLDIELAIKFGYPAANMFKLLIRKVKCLHVLSIWTNDIEDIKASLRKLQRSSDVKDVTRAEISHMFDFIENTQPEDFPRDELDAVDETMMKVPSVNKSLPSAADTVEMTHDNDEGRYLLTNKDVLFGRLLIGEEPYVCNLAFAKRKDYCYHCFARLHSRGLGCKFCTQILYCTEECRDANADLHSYECDGLLDFQEMIGVAYIVSHIMFKVNFELSSIPIQSRKTVEYRPLEKVLSIPMADWPDLVFRNSYATVLSLQDHASDYDYDAMMGYVLTAVYLMIAFKHSIPKLETVLSDDQNLLVIGSVVLRHLLQLQTNLISVLDQNLQDMAMVGHSLVDVDEQPIGIGIYPTVSMLNHSCKPSILSIFHRNKFIARAARPLECGSKITYCYGPSFNRMSKKDRQERLKEQYFFTCGCECCANDDVNETIALLCPKCQGAVVYNRDFTNQCAGCKTENVLDAITVLDRIKTLSNQILEVSEGSEELDKKIAKLRNVEKELATLVHWRNPLFVKIKNTLIDIADDVDLEATLKFCEEELDLCQKTTGKDSYETVITKLKLINARWKSLHHEIENAKTNEIKVSAINELEKLPTIVNETRSKLREILASTNIFGAEASFNDEIKFLNDIQSYILKYLTSLDPNGVENHEDNHKSPIDQRF